MDHRHALNTQAAERYLLGELPAAEAEEFELHYFECPHCALAVESGDMFIDTVRSGVGGGPQPVRIAARREESGRSFWQSLAAFWRQPAFALTAAAAMAGVALYQGTLVIPSLRQTLNEARPLPAFQLIGASRGEDPKVHAPAGAPFVSLAADIPPEAHFRNYLCVVSRAGKVDFKVVNPAPDAGHPITILVPAAALRAGKQELTIYGQGSDGQPGEKISAFPFDFEVN